MKYLIKGQSMSIPENFRWLAQDANGNYWAYEAEPHQHSSGWYENEIGDTRLVGKAGPNPDWRTTLQVLDSDIPGSDQEDT